MFITLNFDRNSKVLTADCLEIFRMIVSVPKRNKFDQFKLRASHRRKNIPIYGIVSENNTKQNSSLLYTCF